MLELSQGFQDPPKYNGIDEQLFHFLQQFPNLRAGQWPFKPFTEKILKSALLYKLCGGSSTHLDFMFGKLASTEVQGAHAIPCGHVFKKGDGIYRCQ